MDRRDGVAFAAQNRDGVDHSFALLLRRHYRLAHGKCARRCHERTFARRHFLRSKSSRSEQPGGGGIFDLAFRFKPTFYQWISTLLRGGRHNRASGRPHVCSRWTSRCTGSVSATCAVESRTAILYQGGAQARAWCIRFVRRLDWLAAADLLVFLPHHARLTRRQPCRGADRVLCSGAGDVVAYRRADFVRAVYYFQQCQLADVARRARPSPFLCPAAGGTSLPAALHGIAHADHDHRSG